VLTWSRHPIDPGPEIRNPRQLGDPDLVYKLILGASSAAAALPVRPNMEAK
jgi:hypothetical protein